MELGDHASMVKHDHLISTGVDRLELGHDALDVVQGFYLMACPVNHVAPQARDDGGHALLSRFLAVSGKHRLSHDYDRGLRTASRVQPEVSSAASDYEANVCVGQIVSS